MVLRFSPAPPPANRAIRPVLPVKIDRTRQLAVGRRVASALTPHPNYRLDCYNHEGDYDSEHFEQLLAAVHTSRVEFLNVLSALWAEANFPEVCQSQTNTSFSFLAAASGQKECEAAS